MTIGCADGTVKMVDFSAQDFTPLKTLVFEPKEEEKGKPCLHHYSSKTMIAAGSSTGSVNLFSKETKELIMNLPQIHKFEVFGTSLYEEKELFTASDDATFKGVDIASGTVMFTNKRHFTGVTSVEKVNANHILVTSHDGTISLFDSRKPTSEAVEQIKPDSDASVWDVKWSFN